MSRKGLILASALVVASAGVASVLLLLLRHEADWYVHCDLPPAEERAKASGDFFLEFTHLISAHKDPYFSARFTAKEINSFFAVDFVKSGLAERTLPENVREPRIAIDPDKIRLAFRYGSGWCNTVVSIDIGVWLPHQANKDHNVIALELQSMHAGSLPVAAQSLLEQVSDAARQQNVEVTWYRRKGNPVALLRFQSDHQHPTVQLEHLELRQGLILIRGRSSNSNGLQAMLHLFPDLPALRTALAN